MPAGYSGTPLAKKLSLQDGQRVWRDGMPASVAVEIDAAGLALVMLDAPEAGMDVAQLFAIERATLAAGLARVRPLLASGGMIWASWPKRAAKVPTDISEDVVRELAFPLGLVDVKVCAIDAIWSGLKLVIRKKLRT